PALLEVCAQRAAQRDGAQRLRWHTRSVDTADELAALLDDAELVIHVCDQPMVSRARLLDRLCAGRGVPLAQAMAHGEDVWLGTAGRVGGDGPGASDGCRPLAALAQVAATQ